MASNAFMNAAPFIGMQTNLISSHQHITQLDVTQAMASATNLLRDGPQSQTAESAFQMCSAAIKCLPQEAKDTVVAALREQGRQAFASGNVIGALSKFERHERDI